MVVCLTHFQWIRKFYFASTEIQFTEYENFQLNLSVVNESSRSKPFASQNGFTCMTLQYWHEHMMGPLCITFIYNHLTAPSKSWKIHVTLFISTQTFSYLFESFVIFLAWCFHNKLCTENVAQLGTIPISPTCGK